MNESDETEPTTGDVTPEAAATAVAENAQASAPADLSNRPAPEWLDEVEGEIGDVDLVLKCLARDSATMCKTCHDLETAGELATRSVLVRCAGSKQPR